MKVWLPILVLLVGMGIAYGISLTEPETEEEEKVETSPIVQTISPAAQTHTIEVTGHGLVTPSRELSVHPELLGKVIGQHPREEPHCSGVVPHTCYRWPRNHPPAICEQRRAPAICRHSWL